MDVLQSLAGGALEVLLARRGRSGGIRTAGTGRVAECRGSVRSRDRAPSGPFSGAGVADSKALGEAASALSSPAVDRLWDAGAERIARITVARPLHGITSTKPRTSRCPICRDHLVERRFQTASSPAAVGIALCALDTGIREVRDHLVRTFRMGWGRWRIGFLIARGDGKSPDRPIYEELGASQSAGGRLGCGSDWSGASRSAERASALVHAHVTGTSRAGDKTGFHGHLASVSAAAGRVGAPRNVLRSDAAAPALRPRSKM